MGICSSSDQANGVKNQGKRSGGNSNQPMSEEELKRILLERQVELSSKARPLLECTTHYKDDMASAASIAYESGESGSNMGSTAAESAQGPPKVTSKQQLYKMAKAEAQQDWIIFDDLPDLTRSDMDKLLEFKEVVMDSLPKLLEQGKIHDVGLELLNRTDLTRVTTANNSGTATPVELPPKPPAPILGIKTDVDADAVANAGESAPAEDDGGGDIISFQRQNSKFLDIRSTVTAKFGSLDNIPEQPLSPDIKTAVIADSVDGVVSAPRFESGTNAENCIQAVRQNSLERLTDLSKLKFVNNSAVVGVNGGINSSPVKNGLGGDNVITLARSPGGGSLRSPRSAAKKDDYDAPKGRFCEQYARDIYETYKRGGRVSRDTVHKVLRNAYRSLKSLPNTTKITVAQCDDPAPAENRERLTIVGDIHGQLYDLIHILDESGLPSATNKYVFNGDFVDRGPSGVEVMVILMAFHAVFPESVCLNRGNHEDYAICCVYGFQEECCNKYDEVTFGMFVEVFQYLPLFAVVNQTVLVVHGGLFHSTKISLDELADINRSDFSLKDLPQSGESLEPIPRENKRDFLKQLQRDALWSDPTNEDTGISQSSRGAGVMFGMDIADRFLKDNNLSMIFRSHECVQHGFEFPYAQARGYAKVKSVDPSILCTVFSASNYGGHSDNSGAYIVLVVGADAVETENSTVKPVHVAAVPNNPAMKYTAYQYSITGAVRQQMVESFTTSSWSIFNIVRAKHADLRSNFEVLDSAQEPSVDVAVADAGGDDQPVDLTPKPTGWITFIQWADVMHHVTKVDLRWMSMIPVVVPDQFIKPSSADSTEHLVNYGGFLDHYLNGTGTSATAGVDSEGGLDSGKSVIETLYAHHKQMEIIFNFFDEDGIGQISKEQFLNKCKLINEVDTVDENAAVSITEASSSSTTGIQSDIELVSEDKAVTLFGLLDLDNDGYVDVNEFFEIYRVIDVKTTKPKSANDC